MSIEILSNQQVILSHKAKEDKHNTNKKTYEYLKNKNEEKKDDKNIGNTLANMKISNQKIEDFLYEQQDMDKPVKKKALLCTKCQGSSFHESDELRKHFKTKWHNFNAKLSARVLLYI